MKKYFCLLFALTLILAFSCINDTRNDSADKNSNDSLAVAKFQFDEEVHDFGTLKQGERVSYSFNFRNTGDADLIIGSVKTSCGCTATEYTKEPIAPGGNGEVEITFDSAGKKGSQYKTITITANTDPSVVELVITANVLEPGS